MKTWGLRETTVIRIREGMELEKLALNDEDVSLYLCRMLKREALETHLVVSLRMTKE